MRLTSGMFSSNTPEYETPNELYNALDSEFGFTVDVCAQSHNAKCPYYFTPSDDGLKQDWSKHICWMNPPYGQEIVKWVKKAYLESLRGSLVVALLPARTDTRWWHEFVMEADEIRLIKGRVRFVGYGPAPFPSCIVIWGISSYSDKPKVISWRQ